MNTDFFSYECKSCCCVRRHNVDGGIDTETPLNPWCWPCYTPLCLLCSTGSTCCACSALCLSVCCCDCCGTCCLNNCVDCYVINCHQWCLGKECFWNTEKTRVQKKKEDVELPCECKCVRYRDTCCGWCNWKPQCTRCPCME